MKKHTKHIVLGILLSMVTLGFASKNNLGLNFSDLGWSNDLTQISEEEVQKRVDAEVIAPLINSLTIRDPHLFMTKCYTSLDATLGDESVKNENRVFYDNQIIMGTVKLDYCRTIDIMCKYQLSLKTNEVRIRESYLKPWISLKEFQKQIETVKAEE